MTATDELRRLLDERGEEHYDATEGTLWLKDGVGYRACADEGLNGLIHLSLWCTTPAQAVEATLGSKVTGETSDGYHTFNELYEDNKQIILTSDRPPKDIKTLEN